VARCLEATEVLLEHKQEFRVEAEVEKAEEMEKGVCLVPTVHALSHIDEVASCCWVEWSLISYYLLIHLAGVQGSQLSVIWTSFGSIIPGSRSTL
jgi:hypothetical protein